MMPSLQEPAIELLLIEDNKGDVMLAKRAFSGLDTSVHFHVASHGREALDALAQLRPDLILLDLNMPIMNGKEFLTHLKSDPELATIPVIVLTSSQARSEVISCYQAHANAYLVKPSAPESFAEMARAIEAFWFQHTILPNRVR